MARLATLEAAMGEMEAARATFEAKARRVSDELQKLQCDQELGVLQCNTDFCTRGTHLASLHHHGLTM